MKDEITIIIPLPPPAAHPNARSATHHARGRAVKKQREDAAWACLEALQDWPAPPRWEAISVQPKYYRPAKGAKPMDPDNLRGWLKGTIDEMQHRGIVVNDRHVIWLEPIEVLGPKAGKARVEIVVRKANA